MLEYIKGVRKEASKIIFPDKEDIKRKTLIVFAVCGASALFLWGISELVIEGLKVVL